MNNQNLEEPLDNSSDEETQKDEATVPSAVANLLSVETMINGFLVDLDKLQSQIKTQKDMFNDAFNNDAEYSKKAEVAKKANKDKTAEKLRIIQLPAVKELADRIGELKDEIKSTEEGLSSYLQTYEELAGTNQITSEDGSVHEIIISRKLVKRASGK